MEFIFVICILVLPISILHLCNIFFFNKIYKFNYNLYFMSFAIFYGLIGWLFFFISYFQLINFQLINSLFIILFFTSLLISYRFRYYNLIPKIKNFKTNTKFWLIIFLCIFVVIGDFLESLSPLTNYDTLAYHLTIPTKIIESNCFFTRILLLGKMAMAFCIGHDKNLDFHEKLYAVDTYKTNF